MDKPTFVSRTEVIANKEYVEWLHDLKLRFREAQNKAAIHVNIEMLQFYWRLGRDMCALHIEERWGEGIVSQLSIDLRNMFPDTKGFSNTNIKYIRRWYLFYYQSNIISQQAVDQLELPEKFTFVSWGNHIQIFTKSKSVEEALFYIDKTIEGNWSRRVLEDNIESKLFERQGAAITNFAARLPQTQQTSAQEMLKDPYNFGFLTLHEGYNEKELEDALIANITRFLLELGKGFAYVGKQRELRMSNGQSFFPDLIFYHIPQKRYVVIDLKVVDFKPEFAGKINFYVTAVDELMKGDDDNSTVGLLICKTADKTIVEWSLRGNEQPLGVATYDFEQIVKRTVFELEQHKNNNND